MTAQGLELLDFTLRSLPSSIIVDSSKDRWSLSKNRDVRKKHKRDIGKSVEDSIPEFQSPGVQKNSQFRSAQIFYLTI